MGKIQGIHLVPDVGMSYLAENNPDFKPVYITVPKKLCEIFNGSTILLYPYEWTEQEAEEWVKQDVKKWKAEKAEEL